MIIRLSTYAKQLKQDPRTVRKLIQLSCPAAIYKMSNHPHSPFLVNTALLNQVAINTALEKRVSNLELAIQSILPQIADCLGANQ